MTLSELKKERKFWQRMLRLAGYYHGAIDGVIGKQSKAAEAAWDADVEKALNEYGRFDDRTEQNLATLIPAAQMLARKWFMQAAGLAVQEGLSIRLICGTRTYAEQDALYRKRPRVTKAKGGYSWHNFGLAWDFCVFEDKQPIWEHNLYNTAGALARDIDGLEWGGDWKSFVDKPHIQLNRFSSTAAARSCFEA
ncbi:MAG: M15 family metallopeptidase [Akkermansia sp.]